MRRFVAVAILSLVALPALHAQDPTRPETTPQAQPQPAPRTPADDSGNAGYTPAPHTFSSDALHLRFTYPPILQEQPAADAVTHGRIRLLGLDANRVTSDSKADLTACLHPLFFARSAPPAIPSTTTEHTAPDGSSTTVRITPAPVASLLLAELDTACLSAHEQVTRTDLLSGLAQQFLTTPGMSRNAGPATYNIGYQRVTMAAAQGHPQSGPQPGSEPDPHPDYQSGAPPDSGATSPQPASSPLTIFTMAVATNWSNRLLVWLLSANQIQLLDELSKSTVRFGRSAAAPLYPEAIGNSTPSETR